jgi:hypothetical protein
MNSIVCITGPTRRPHFEPLPQNTSQRLHTVVSDDFRQTCDEFVTQESIFDPEDIVETSPQSESKLRAIYNFD